MEQGSELHRQGTYAASARVYLEVVRRATQEHAAPSVLTSSLISLGVEYAAAGRYADAMSQFSRAATYAERRLGTNNAIYAKILVNMASVRGFQGDRRRAEVQMREGIATYESVVARDDLRLAWARNCLGWLLVEERRLDDAEPLLEQARATFARGDPTVRSELAIVINNIATLRDWQGRTFEAAAAFRESLALLEAVFGRNHPHVARALNNLATTYYRLGRFNEAEDAFQRAVEIVESRLDAGHPLYPHVLGNYAQFLRRMGRKAEAKPLEVRAKAARSEHALSNGDGLTIDARDLASFRKH